MVVTPHVIAGTLVGIVYARFYSGQSLRWGVLLPVAILAFTSHFLVDMIPHWDYQLSLAWPNLIIPLVDAGLAFLLVWFCATRPDYSLGLLRVVLNAAPFYVAGFFAILPDILMRTYLLLGESGQRLNGFAEFHNWIHATYRPGPVLGLIIQVTFTILVCLLIRVWR